VCKIGIGTGLAKKQPPAKRESAEGLDPAHLGPEDAHSDQRRELDRKLGPEAGGLLPGLAIFAKNAGLLRILATVSDLRARTRRLRSGRMRDRDTIDSELRLLAAVRRVCREQDGVVPSIGPVDETAGRTPRA
jgi:hypothetical protein